jgi:hypothetical protein
MGGSLATRGATYGSADVERECVRMLWTYHFATTDQLSRLVFASSTPALRRRISTATRRLLAMHMVWREPRQTSPGYRNHGHGRLSGGWYYGLTEAGRAWAARSMPELTALHCITRESYMTDPDRRTITHSAHCTEYCTRLVECLRGHPLALGLFFETESTVMGAHLRMDCLIRLRLYRQAPVAHQPAAARPPWYVPWLPTLRTARPPGALDVTFALEIDEGSEKLAVLSGKALNYRRTYSGGQRLLDVAGNETDTPAAHWQKVLCSPDTPDHSAAQLTYFPIPVFVMTSDQRLANVWAAWRQGWPGAEVRMTTWTYLDGARSVASAPYLNQRYEWVDLLGNAYDG